MSWLPGLLFPWFVAATAAITLPIVFHLIRRAPRGQKPFSSLMFVPQSPPRLTRRSRLDHLLLLLLRVAVLCLLAFAFARPYFSDAASLNFLTARQRRVAILLDTSASMQRPGVWTAAQAEADRVLDDIDQRDDVALFHFDNTIERVIDFDSSQTPSNTQAKVAAIQQSVAEMTPSWGTTRLDTALAFVADAMETLSDVQQSGTLSQIVLITDLQRGSGLDALQTFQWPEAVRTTVRRVAATRAGNASLQIVEEETDIDAEDDLRVRVANESDSTVERFVLQWRNSKNESASVPSVDVYVPAGEVRVIRVPRPPADGTAARLTLEGDPIEFDNTTHMVAEARQDVRVVYVGDDTIDDTRSLAFFLDRALVDSRWRHIDLSCYKSTASNNLPDLKDVRMVVVSHCETASDLRAVGEYLKSGGTVLFVVENVQAKAALAKLADAPHLVLDEADGGYALLGEIDFLHPLFAPFADPRFNDFTKIRFLKHRRLTLADESGCDVLARFDDGAPALIQRQIERGRLFVLTSGWHPIDSRLALSTKFVPLMLGFLDQGRPKVLQTTQLQIGDSVPLPTPTDRSVTRRVVKPDGTVVPLRESATAFDDTDQPGVYVFQSSESDSFGEESRGHDSKSPPKNVAFREHSQTLFAVNLPASESKTEPLAIDALEQYGVQVGAVPTRAAELEKLRQLHDIELESRQKVWRTALIAAIALLIFETWLAGRQAGRIRSVSLATLEGSPPVASHEAARPVTSSIRERETIDG